MVASRSSCSFAGLEAEPMATVVADLRLAYCSEAKLNELVDFAPYALNPQNLPSVFSADLQTEHRADRSKWGAFD